MIADLNPYAEYKESGLPWLGHVPGHWDVQRLKNWVTINRRTLGEKTPPNFAFDYIDIGSVTTGRLAKRPSRMCFADAPSRARRILQPGDTIVSTVRTYLKAVMTVTEQRPRTRPIARRMKRARARSSAASPSNTSSGARTTTASTSG